MYIIKYIIYFHNFMCADLLKSSVCASLNCDSYWDVPVEEVTNYCHYTLYCKHT